MTKTIRDFIYLDVERVRSWVAQAAGGLVSERASGREHATGGKGSAKGRVPFLVEVGGEADYHYRRSLTETLSVHDAIFAEFCEHLTPTQGPQDAADWVEAAFRDGEFVQTKGRLKIVDYKDAIRRLESLPKFADAVTRLGNSATAVQQNPSRNTIPRAQSPQTAKLDPKQVRDITHTANEVYGDLIRIKVLPFPEDDTCSYVGAGDRASFRYRPDALSIIYGSVIDADWTVVAQVNKGRVATVPPTTTDDQSLEDRFEALVYVLDELTQLAQGIRFPAVAVTPVAIYRDVQAA